MCLIKRIIKQLNNIANDAQYNKLVEKYNKTYVDFALYVTYGTDSNKLSNSEICKKILQRHQKKFRNDIVERDTKCIITGSDEKYCEACHIVPYAESSNKNKFNINNGLLLCKMIHDVFDKYQVSINPVTSRFVV